jgi:hypothetical protein
LRDGLSKMAAGEFAAGPGLQIPLKLERRRFFVEFNDDQRPPWPHARGVRREAIVVCRQPCGHVGRDAHVVLGWIGDAFQDVDESLRQGHAVQPATL